MDVGVSLFGEGEGEGCESLVVVASGFVACVVCVVGGDVVVMVLGGF